MNKKIATKEKMFRRGATILAFLFSILVAGCSVHSGKHGVLQLRGKIDDIFESHQVMDNYNYYYSGRDARPDAILGVNKKYSLRSRLWKPVDLTSEQLRLWVDMMTDHRGYSVRTYGAEVLGPGGEHIGIWYSPWSWTTVRLEDDNNVIIHTPSGEPFLPKRGLMLRGRGEW